MLIKPFIETVNSLGQALATITTPLSNLTWKIYQIGMGLALPAPSAQVAAHLNGVPYTASVTMQPSIFAQIPGASPYFLEGFFNGPPYPVLSAGDQIVIGLVGAQPGDQFTVSIVYEEIAAKANATMGS